MGTSSQRSANTRRRQARLITELRTIVRALLSAALNASVRQARDQAQRNAGDINTGDDRAKALAAFASAPEKLGAAYLDEVSSYFRLGSTGEHSLEIEDLGNTDGLGINMAVTRLCAQIHIKHREALDQIETGLQTLSARLPGAPHRLALHPESLIKPFQRRIDPVAKTDAGRVALCELFAEQLSARLEDLYSRAQRILFENPDTPQRPGGAVVDHPTVDRTTNAEIKSLRTGEFLAPIALSEWFKTPETSQPANGAEPRYVESPSPIDTEMRHLIGRYLSAESDSDELQSRRHEVIAAITAASRTHCAANAPLSAQAIKALIKSHLARDEQGRPARISRNDARIVALVCEIYRSSLGENVVVGHMATLLTRLQFPIIKLALLDTTFIQDPLHPGRGLLNELVSLGVGVSDRSGPLFRYLQHVVSGVVDGFDSDVDVFRKALTQLRKIGVVAGKKPRTAAADSGAQARESARRSGAKRMVVATMNRHIKNKRLPEEVLDFVLNCWAPFMALTYYNHGADSQNWRSSAQTLRRLIRGAGPKISEHDFDHLIGNPKDFFDDIANELARVSFRKETHCVSRLAKAYAWYEQAALRARAGHQHVPDFLSETDEDERSSNTNPAQHEGCAGDSSAWLNMLLACVPTDVRPGAWFEIFRGRGLAKRRLKVTSIRQDTGHVLFTDHSGEVMLHVHLETFLQDLRTGRSKLINDSNLFDRALASFIRSSSRQSDRSV
ncbi:MAG: DUF1631 family protein [Gammaproteobacteria bacterium]